MNKSGDEIWIIFAVGAVAAVLAVRQVVTGKTLVKDVGVGTVKDYPWSFWINFSLCSLLAIAPLERIAAATLAYLTGYKTILPHPYSVGLLLIGTLLLARRYRKKLDREEKAQNEMGDFRKGTSSKLRW